MCGIVGYVGNKRVVPVIIDGLKRLEYRGYDSAGIAVCGNGEGLQIRRAEGKLRNLEEVIRLKPLDGTYGIGHTRWATHGRPTEENAHPHRDCSGRIVVVHNGIVENYLFLKRKLKEEGHKFTTETDTEVIAHLIENYYLKTGNGHRPALEEGVRKAVKDGFKIFMLKEIYEQPRTIRDTTRGRVSQDSGQVFLDEMQVTADEFKAMKKLNITACGTSWHAGLAGKFMIETLARVPVEVDYASEWRYRDPIMGPDTITMLISQSGETADTIAAQREAKARGSKTLAICNVVGSMITREAAGTIYTHAGPEIGVASTKAFTAQLTALYLFALYLAQLRGTMSAEEAKAAVQELTRIPGKLEHLLTHEEDCEDLAKEYVRSQDFLFLGRGIHYPIALEGALKLKEISYIHAEGYPAGEMKHGPNALIDENLPVVIIATRDPKDELSMVRYEKSGPRRKAPPAPFPIGVFLTRPFDAKERGEKTLNLFSLKNPAGQEMPQN